MADVYVAAGSNVEPERNLARALDWLEHEFGTLAISPAYRNPAVGFAGEDFINLVVGFRTDDTPPQVKEKLERIELSCGRPRGAPKWAPRTMDLDLLMYDQLVSDEPGLILPRPDLLRRAFMLKPLADLAPGLLHPAQHRTIGELWAQFPAADHPLVRTMQDALAHAWPAGSSTSAPSAPIGMSFWTDASVLGEAGIPTLLFGPAGAGLHSTEEYVDVASVLTCRDALVELARRWLT